MLGSGAAARGTRTIVVGGDAAFEWAAAELRWTGGTIVLRPGSYASLEIGPRSAAALHVVGSRGTRVGRFLLWRPPHVWVGNLAIRAVGEDARLGLQGEGGSARWCRRR